ncbi:helix-hairpin-helix domain-containing protein [Sporosarcina sp. A2]|uniref:helix-hairpin-helix domain-containing protein n=1 Tax=Sporosarcina sp. A2 TaxID=3393449 RepID=UPI003D79FD13
MFFPRGQGEDELLPDENLYDSLVTTPEPESMELLTEPVKEVPDIIVIDVKGAVLHPNVYTLQEGQRLIDAITAAGGYTQHADSRHLNHAERLSDEAVIYVPVIGEELPDFQQHTETTETSDSSTNLVNLNLADESQLQTLTGIGPAKAAAIIKYRTEQGAFQKIDDLKKVSGIGEKTFEALSDSISVK